MVSLECGLALTELLRRRVKPPGDHIVQGDLIKYEIIPEVTVYGYAHRDAFRRDDGMDEIIDVCVVENGPNPPIRRHVINAGSIIEVASCPKLS